jgi:hypothetical protein
MANKHYSNSQRAPTSTKMVGLNKVKVNQHWVLRYHACRGLLQSRFRFVTKKLFH